MRRDDPVDRIVVPVDHVLLPSLERPIPVAVDDVGTDRWPGPPWTPPEAVPPDLDDEYLEFVVQITTDALSEGPAVGEAHDG